MIQQAAYPVLRMRNLIKVNPFLPFSLPLFPVLSPFPFSHSSYLSFLFPSLSFPSLSSHLILYPPLSSYLFFPSFFPHHYHFPYPFPISCLFLALFLSVYFPISPHISLFPSSLPILSPSAFSFGFLTFLRDLKITG